MVVGGVKEGYLSYISEVGKETLTAGERAFQEKSVVQTKAEKSIFREKITLVSFAGLQAGHLPEHVFCLIS